MSDKEGGLAPKLFLQTVLVHGVLALGIILVILMLGALAISGGSVKLENRLALVLAAEFLGIFIASLRAAKRAKARKLPVGLLTGLAVFVFLSVLGFFVSFPPAGHWGFLFIVALLAALSGGMLSEKPLRRRRHRD